MGNGLRTAHRDEDRLLLGLVAQNLLTRSQLDLKPTEGAITGDIEGGLRWRIESQPYPVPQDLLPEAPVQAQEPAFASRDPSATEGSANSRSADRSSFGDGSSSFGDRSTTTADTMEQQPAETSSSPSNTTEAQQEPREPVRLRLIRVLVEKGDQQFALSTLAVEPPRGRNGTR
ncbi:MAG: hypothetical protein AB7I59_06820 [Geminicoccaceae bacterium]